MTIHRLRRDDLEGPARRAAAWLAANGAGTGDRVAVVARNHPSTLALAHGALRSGVVPVLLGPGLPAEERDWIVRDARPAVVVDDPAALPLDDTTGDGLDLAEVPLGRPMLDTSGTSGDRKSTRLNSSHGKISYA